VEIENKQCADDIFTVLFLPAHPLSSMSTSKAHSTTTETPKPNPLTAYLNALASRHEEYQYLDLLEHIMTHGERRNDRTGTGTLAVFAPPQLRFSLRDGRFPLLTTKRVPFRAVAEELLWFVRGETDARKLAEKGVHIWDGNGSKEFLEKVGLGHRREGDLGPIYGWQWRHFGAKYTNCEADYTGQGVDQLAELIHKIRHQPHDRRLIISAWNVAGECCASEVTIFIQ
jgi:thymidylate synthase